MHQKYQNISALINKKELIIIYPIDRTEDNGIRSFSNRYGLIYDTIIDGGDFAIINKATIYEEELFSIVNKKISDKDTRWIMKNIIENDLSEDNEKKIYVLNTTLIIENGNNTYDIIKTYKQKSDILRLYFKLEELYKDNKITLEDIDYDTDEIRTILKKNLSTEIYDVLEKYLNENSYLKTIWSYYDDE